MDASASYTSKNIELVTKLQAIQRGKMCRQLCLLGDDMENLNKLHQKDLRIIGATIIQKFWRKFMIQKTNLILRIIGATTIIQKFWRKFMIQKTKLTIHQPIIDTRLGEFVKSFPI